MLRRGQPARARLAVPWAAGGERPAPRRRGGLAAAAPIVLLALLAAAPPLAAQDAVELDTPQFTLKPSSRILLSRLQGKWLEWLGAMGAGDAAAATVAVDELLAYAEQVGMSRLPDLSVGAAAKAVERARAGDLERAAWAIEAARRLDPERPEIAFAEGAVAAASGDRLRSLRLQLHGLVLSLRVPLEREIAIGSAVSWALSILLMVALVFVGLQMTGPGVALYGEILGLLRKSLPAPLAHAGCLLILLWPLLLHMGPVWLAAYWAVLLWAHAGRAVRVVLVLVWVVMATFPILISQQTRRVGVAQMPQVRAVENAARGRLEGTILTDMVVLRESLPASTAVDHVFADLHRKLGQCDLARVLYRRVLEAEPDNAAALADLGVCDFESAAFGRAIAYFRRAAESGPPNAAVQFNLSQAYSELYRFRESERALREARRLDSVRVNRWMRLEHPRRIVPLDGGFERVEEIRSELSASWRGTEAGSPWSAIWRRSLTVPMAIAFVVLAIGLRVMSRGAGRRDSRTPAGWLRGPADRWRRVLLPGVAEAENGEWLGVFGAVVPLTALLTLPMLDAMVFRMPWTLGAGSHVIGVVVAAGLALYLAVRWWREGER